MQLVAVHGEEIEGSPWLMSYEPDAHPIPQIEATADPADAMRFQTAAEAAELWRRVSVEHPLRSDGRPNRPLSAFTINITDLPEGGETVDESL